MALWQRILSPFKNRGDISAEFADELAHLESEIGYRFTNPNLLERALTHASYSAEKDLPFSYERLEFLGDAVLQLTVSEYLFKQHPHLNEGTLTKYRTILVNGSYLAECARGIGVQSWVRHSTATRGQRSRESDSIMADVVEAIIGALYIDGGLDSASRWIHSEIISRKPNYADELKQFNHKGQLAERCQRLHLGTPEYEITNTTGPDHDRCYTVQVVINGRVAGFGEGHSKKEASQRASEDTLNNWDAIFPEYS